MAGRAALAESMAFFTRKIGFHGTIAGRAALGYQGRYTELKG